MRPVARLLIVAGMLPWLASAGPAARAGGDGVLPVVDPEGPLRILDQDGSRTTSDCIGYPVTPLCAAETMLACSLRWNRELCRIARGEKSGPPSPFVPDAMSVTVLKYRVVAALFLNAELIPPSRTNHPGAWRPGDVAVTVERWFCAHGRCRAPGSKDNMSYILRADGGNWRVIAKDNYWDFTDWPPPGATWARE